MADIVSAEKRSQMMSGIGAKNTKPEIIVRKLLHHSGYRFRLHRKNLPGKPDIVLPKFNTVLFVHGCFWHGHQDCHLFRLPKTRTAFWARKIHENQTRDETNNRNLVEMGWRIFTIWECTLKGKGRLEAQDTLRLIEEFLHDDLARVGICRGFQTPQS